MTDHLGRLGASNGKLQVGILLPVAEEERKLREEAVVHVAHELDGGRAGVARHAALEVSGASDEGLPIFEAVLVLGLHTVSSRSNTRV